MLVLELEIENEEEFTLEEEQELTLELEEDNTPYTRWRDVTQKPFETLSEQFNVVDNKLNIDSTNQPIQNSTKLFTSDGAFSLKQQIDRKVPIDTRITNSQIDEIFS